MISGPHAVTFRIERPADALGALLWRCPVGRVPIGARISVGHDECAVFMSSGAVLGSLGPGSYALAPREQRFLEPAVDIASDGRELACDVFLIATGVYSGVEVSGSLGKLSDEAGVPVPLWFLASLTLRARDPERVATALDAQRGDPMEAVRFVAIRALRGVVERLSRRGELVAATVSRSGATVKKAAREDGLGLEALGMELVEIDRLELTRQGPPPPAPAAGSSPGAFGAPPATGVPGQVPTTELAWTIPGVPHFDAVSQLLAHVNFHGSFVGDPVPPHLAQWVVDRIGEALFLTARTFAGNVLEVPMHAAALSAMLSDQTTPALTQAGLRGRVVVTGVELSPADPGIAELLRRAGQLR